MKTLLEFISICQASPTGIAAALGDSWTPMDVARITDEIARLAGIPLSPDHPATDAGQLP